MAAQWISLNRSNACPVCDSTSGKCRQSASDPDLILCMTYSERIDIPGFKQPQNYLTKDGLWGKFYRSDSTDNWQDALERRNLQRKKQADKEARLQAQHQARSLPPQERDRLYRQLLSELSLSSVDREDLQRRGYSDEMIQEVGHVSVVKSQPLKGDYPDSLPGVDSTGKKLLVAGSGYLCPVRDTDGLIVALQVRLRGVSESKYRWLSAEGNYKLPNGEMPLSHCGEDSGDWVAFCEGTGAKPQLAAARLGCRVLGAAGGLFANSAEQIKAAIASGKTPVLLPDGGAVKNPHILRNYQALAALVPNLMVLWWNQVEKGSDIDEANTETVKSAQLISFSDFEAIAIATGYKPAKNQKVTDLKERYRLRSQQIQAQLNTLTIKPDVVLNQRYLGELPVPKPGTMQFVSSPCNTGKTTASGGIVRTHREQYPQGKQLMIGSRNGLLRQTGFKIGIPHIQELDTYLPKERAVALCLDSLHRIPVDSITPNTLIILDEGDATILHGLEGGTLGDRHAESLEHFSNILNRVLELDGMVLVLEDGITDLPINFLKELTQGRFPIHLTVNKHQATPWKSVEIASGFKSGFISYIAARLTAGEKLLIPSSSQEFAEDLEWIVKNQFPHKKVIRVDSKTSELPLIKDFMRSPDALLQRKNPDVLIYTSSAESGIDINYPGFDRMCGYLVNLEVRKQYQMLSRSRLSIPRTIFTREFATHEDCISTDPSVILKEWERQKEHTAKLCNLESDLDTPEQGMKLWGDRQKEQFWNKWMAFYRARAIGSQARMEENLIDLLQRRGHPVTQRPKWAIDKVYSEVIQQAVSTRINATVELWQNSDTTGLTPDEAHSILNSTESSYTERVRAQKLLKQQQFTCCNFDDPEFLRKAVVESKGRYLKASTLLWLTDHPAIASQLDRQAFKKQLDKPFVVLKRLKHNRGAVDTVGALLVKGLKELSDGREYRDSDDLVQQVHQAALDDSYNVKRFLGLNVKPEHTATQTVNKLLKKLGFTCDVIRKEGKRGSQIRIWAVTDSQCEHRQSIFASLKQKYADWLKPNGEDGSSSVVTTSIKEESLIQIVTTDPPGLTNLPPDWASDFRSAWQTAQNPEAKTAILEAIAQCQQVIKQPLVA